MWLILEVSGWSKLCICTRYRCGWCRSGKGVRVWLCCDHWGKCLCVSTPPSSAFTPCCCDCAVHQLWVTCVGTHHLYSRGHQRCLTNPKSMFRLLFPLIQGLQGPATEFCQLTIDLLQSRFKLSSHACTKSSYDVSTNVGTIRADTGMAGDADRNAQAIVPGELLETMSQGIQEPPRAPQKEIPVDTELVHQLMDHVQWSSCFTMFCQVCCWILQRP